MIGKFVNSSNEKHGERIMLVLRQLFGDRQKSDNICSKTAVKPHQKEL